MSFKDSVFKFLKVLWYLVCICWIQSKALPFLTKKKLDTSIKGQSTNCDRSTKSRPPLPTNPVPHNSTFLLILTDTNSKIPLEYRIIASPPCMSIFLDEFFDSSHSYNNAPSPSLSIFIPFSAWTLLPSRKAQMISWKQKPMLCFWHSITMKAGHVF